MSVAPPDFPPDLPSFVALLRSRAQSPGPGGSFSFVDEAGAEGTRLDFAELDTRARSIAARLGASVLAGERALLLYPPGLDFLPAFFGCLYAGVVAVPAYPPRANRPMPRLRGIVADASPRILLTSGALLDDSGRWAQGVPELAGLDRLATDSVDPDEAADWVDPDVGPGSMAFLQYTSGSTASAKGVIVTHGNLLANSAAIRRCFGSEAGSRGVFWLPLHHDMGLIGGVLQTIYCGGSSTLLSPVAFLQRPVRWLEAISSTGATISGGPDFAFDLCARKVTAEQKAGLDLSRWSVAFDGAEPIRAGTIDRFVEAFAPRGFRREAFLPCYGLAEATLLVSGAPKASGPVVFDVDPAALERDEAVEAGARAPRRLVGSGRVAAGHRVEVVDPEARTPCAEGRVGELWVAGPSVAQGYWGRPEATVEAFGARLAGSGEGPFLRTGDLGFVRDGELFVTGRRKDLIIIGGRNVYPQDVEGTVGRCHPELRPDAAAAFSVEVDGRERLVVAQEVERRAHDPESLFEAIRRSVAEEHELDLHAVALLRPMGLPRTSSGKVQRHAARAGFLEGTLGALATWSAGSGREPGESPLTPAGRSAREVAAWLASKVAGPMGVAPEEVDPRRPFSGFGLGSLQAVGLAGELEAWLGRPLTPTLLYEYPTIEALARHLGEGEVEGEPARAAGDPEPGRDDDHVAIIGIGCRFPGARGPGAFWKLMVDGVDAVGELPEARRADFGGEGVPRGGFLDRVDLFDADFFGISPREAAQVDPQQRLLLEVAWEAMEDAGQVPDRLAGGRVGVFVGISTNDYGRIAGVGGDAHALTGNASSVAANRISYAFDFRGPSLAVDTACSSSLVAVHLACRSLAAGESTLALAGGVNLVLDPEVLGSFEAAGFLAPDGRCKAFDARADGYVRGEGAGVVVLKPLGQARRDGDPIYAVIRGGAVNQDGRSNGLTAPNPEAQEAVIRDAFRAAGVAPSSARYVEAHGTGTLLGDPIEARALGAALADGRAAGDRCAVGSVKANIGHLEAAAGIAGLIKVALALKNGAIPPSLHCREFNPHIPFDALPIEVRTRLGGWPGGAGPRIAGISSFGFGGTNAHVVLESEESAGPVPTVEGRSARLLTISARSPTALAWLARSCREALEGGVPLVDLAYSSSARRSHHEHRLALVAGSNDEAAGLVDAFLRGETRAGMASGRVAPGRRARVAFVFSGQGGLRPGMGRDLLDREPAFRAAFEAVDGRVAEVAGWSILEFLAEGSGSGSESRRDEPEAAQAVQFALQVALAALWRSWGVTPDSVVGHSLGEVAAAHVAGALSLDDAVRVVVARGRLMGRAAGQGRTVAVGLDAAEAGRVVEESGGRLALAAINGPGSSTLSGDPDAVADLVEDLAGRGVFARVLGGDLAFHGPQMDPIRADLERALAGLRPSDASIPMVSTVLGRAVEGRPLDAAYWGRNLRETVRFAEAVDRLIESGHDLFVEVGPSPSLLGPIGDALRLRGREGLAVGSLRRGLDEGTALLRSLAACHVAGVPVDWAAASGPGRFVRPPAYPWQGVRHWAAPRKVEGPPIRVDAPPASAGSGGIDDLVYEVRWVEKPRSAGSNGPTGRWLIVEDRRGVGRAVRGRLEALGLACSSIAPDAGLDLGEGPGPLAGVVYCRALDFRGTDGLTAGSMEAAQAVECGGALELAQALDRLGDSARLWLVTEGAQAVGAGSGLVGLAQSTLWGLGRSIAMEFPGRWGGLLDLDPEAGPADVEAVVGELLGADVEDQVAFRRGIRYVPRLEQSPSPGGGEASGLSIRPEGTYLITGGLGVLGLRAARRLVDRGARRLVLLGRRGLPPRGAWEDLPEGHEPRSIVEEIRGMERAGATVLVAPVDVSDDRRMAALFDRLAGTLPPIRGIVHAAGVVGPGSLRESDAGSLLATLRPKVVGAWVLGRLARSLPLDFLVHFSSVAAVLGAKEGPYAAANAFLDAHAAWAGASGLPATSLGWGPWAGPGMAGGRAGAHRALGLEPLDPDLALDALGRVAADGRGHAVVAGVDWLTFRSAYGRRPLLDRIEDRPEAGRPARTPALDALRALPPGLRREGLVGYFRDRVAGVLRLDPDRLDPDRPLDSMGLDSVMAIELKGSVEADLGTSLPLTALLEGPTIARLADQALGRWGDLDPADLEAEAGSTSPDHPLTPGQRSLWYLYRRMPDDAAYNMAGAARIRASVDVEALRASLQALVDRHPMLRATFFEVDGEPRQRTPGGVVAWFRVEDASGWSEAELSGRLAEAARSPIDLEAGPPFRTWLFTRSAEDHFLVLSIHHIAGDFWSIAILMDELGRIYRAGGPDDLPPPGLAYVDHARRQAVRLEGPEGDRLRAYWAGRLAGPLPSLDLPTDRPRPSVRSHRGSTRSAVIPPDLARRLSELGATRSASLYVTLLAGFQALLGRLSGQEDVIVGSPVAGRDRAGLSGVVGYFANPLPIRVDLSGDPPFEEVLGRVRRAVLDGLEHQEYPFAEMVGQFEPSRDPGRTPLFSAMFAFQKAQRLHAEGLTPFVLREGGRRMDLGGLPVESVALDLGISQFDLTLSAAESDGGLVLTLESSSDLFEPDTADRLLARYRTLLEAVADRPGLRLGDLPLMPDRERELVGPAWNATRADFPRDATIHRLIEVRAARTPGAVAVAFEGETLTHADLMARADRLARRLGAIGVGPGSRVGLAVGRSAEMVVGLLGILRAGAAYVPLDPEYPRDRLAFLVVDAGLSALVGRPADLDRVPAGGVPVVLVDGQGGEDAGRPREATADDVAYVIYTSGTTGTPKGVAVTHRNLVHSTLARSGYYREPVGAFLLVSSFAFDSSVAGLFWTLLDGGTLVIPSPGSHADPRHLADLVARHGVTHWLSVPSLLGLVLAEADPARLGSLRTAIVAGEACPRSLPGLVLGLLPRVALHNEYGPTEATVWSAACRCDDEGGDGPVPIGRPIPNARAYVLDSRMRLVPIGVPGELYVGGEGVAMGYLGRPGLTAERFIPDPFGDRPGGRLYRTGDRARWRADGMLEFLGRLDDQLKVRGFRVEPGEIEAALAGHPNVRDVAAAAFEAGPGDVRLAAYLVPVQAPAPEPSALRAWLRGRLPAPLVPSAFVVLDALPLSPNGKVDRRRLPAPDVARDARPGRYQAPRDAAEAALAGVVSGVLGVERVGVHDDLFDLGVDSILAIQIASRARQAGLALDPGAVFEHPTVEGLAALASPVHVPGPVAAPGGEVEDSYPLSPTQEGMLFHSRLDSEAGVYVQQFTCPIAGELRVGAFEAAWRRVIARHPVLRTSFEGLDSGTPRQVVHARAELPVVHRDWRSSRPSEVEGRVDAYLRADRARGFDPSRSPLLRLALIRTADDAHRLVLSCHHALMDGWCVPVVLGEVLACYEAALDGSEPDLPPSRPYRDYIDWLRARDPAASEAFWRRELAGFREPTPLALARPGTPPEDDHAGCRARLSRSDTSALRAMARSHRLTLGTIVQGAWALLLGRYAGRDEVVFGSTVSGRPAELAGVEAMVGLFINTLPVRVALPGEARVVDWLAGLQDRLVEVRRHEATPLVRVRGWGEVPRGRPLFESLVVFEVAPDDPAARDRAARLGVGEVRAFERTNYPMTLTVVPGTRLALEAAFDARRFDPGAVDRLLGHLSGLLGAMAADPEARLADLALAGPIPTPRSPSTYVVDPDWPRNGHEGFSTAELARLSDEEVEAMIAELSSRGEANHE